MHLVFAMYRFLYEAVKQPIRLGITSAVAFGSRELCLQPTTAGCLLRKTPVEERITLRWDFDLAQSKALLRSIDIFPEALDLRLILNELPTPALELFDHLVSCSIQSFAFLLFGFQRELAKGATVVW